MSTTPADTNIDARLRIYLRGLAFAYPAVVAWVFACVYLVPKLKQICYVARLEPSQVGWLWGASWGLVRDGWLIGLALIFILAVLEVFGGGWARRRRVTVSIVVWVINVIVLFGLTLLILLALIAGASLSSPK